jgi:hypothetical protein
VPLKTAGKSPTLTRRGCKNSRLDSESVACDIWPGSGTQESRYDMQILDDSSGDVTTGI